MNELTVARDWSDGTMKMMQKLTKYTTHFQATIPLDSLNRPLGMVNPNSLLSTGLIASPDEIIDNPPVDAVLPVEYLEGLPTITGLPIWERLEGEAIEYYNMFKRYRDMANVKGTRSVFKLHTELGVPVKTLEVLRRCFHWKLRVEAFDTYMEQERQYIIRKEQIKLEGEHRTVANKIFNQCTNYMLDNVQMLTPKTALEWAKMAVELERLSLGLQPNKPGTINEGQPTVNITNVQGPSNGTQNSGTQSIEDDKQKLRQVMNVMEKVGLFDDVEPEIIEVESTPVKQTETGVEHAKN